MSEEKISKAQGRGAGGKRRTQQQTTNNKPQA